MKSPSIVGITCLLFTVLLVPWAPTLQAQEEMYAARRQALMNSMDGGFAVFFSDAGHR